MNEHQDNNSETVPEWRWSSGRILLLLVLAAAVLRTVAALTRPMIELDETAYVRAAENLMHGRGLLEISGVTSTHFSPLYSLFVAGLSVLVQNYVLAAYIIVIIFGSLVLIPTYLLGKELISERVGLMAAALVAVMPLMIDHSSRLYSESVYVFFLILGILFGRHMLRGCRVPCSILTGMSLGLAYLANPSAIFYTIATFALAVAVAVRNGVWRQMLKALLIFTFTFCLYAVPYVIFLHSETGTWTFNGKSPGVIYSAVQGLDYGTIEWEQAMLAIDENTDEMVITGIDDSVSPVAYIFDHPVDGVKNFIRQSQSFLDRDMARVIPLWLLMLIGLGLFGDGWTRRRAAALGYLAVMMTPVLIILIMYSHDRFFIPFVPLVMIFAAMGWHKLEEWGYETSRLSLPSGWQERSRRLMPWLLGAMVLLPILALALIKVFSHDYPIEKREAGAYLAPVAGIEERVMSREFSAAYYSGATAVMLPYADYDATTRYARDHDVDYLVVGRDEIINWRPQLTRLLGNEEEHSDWEVLTVIRQGSSRETLIFRIRNIEE